MCSWGHPIKKARVSYQIKIITLFSLSLVDKVVW